MGANVKDLIGSYDPRCPLAAASTPPSTWYTDPNILELEQQTVFSRSWQVVARSDQLCGPGHYITADLGGESIVVVRGMDATLRGFCNVCRHHAAAVMTQSEGQAENLRCPYHGWTYDLTGALIHTPEFAGVAGFDRSANGLIPIPVDQWRNWVFATLAPASPSLPKFIGDDLIKRLEALNLGRLCWFERRSYFLNCNWKVFVDNYLDGGYHVPHIHAGLSSVLDNSQYKIEIGERFCLQSSPMTASKSEPEASAVRKGDRAYYFWLYPNFMINVYQDVMDTNRVIPHGVNQTEVVFDYYFADTSEPAREANLASIAISEQIQSEDVAICESVQRGLNSRAYDTGRLSVRREAGEHLFHKLLHADLKMGMLG